MATRNFDTFYELNESGGNYTIISTPVGAVDITDIASNSSDNLNILGDVANDTFTFDDGAAVEFEYVGEYIDDQAFVGLYLGNQYYLITNDTTLTIGDTFSITGTPFEIVTNQAPAVATNETTALSYTENAAATVIAPNLTVTDADDTSLNGATVSITGNFVPGDDVLTFVDNDPGDGITGSFDPATGVLTLTGSGTVAEYEAALRAVSYENSSDDPSTATRTVTFTTTDGAADSTAVTRDIEVTAVNDPATFASLTNTIDEDDVSVSGTVVVTDVDSSNNVVAQSNVATSYGSFTIDANGSYTYVLNNANAAVQALQVGQSLTDAIPIASADGTTSSVEITINGVNDAPVISSNGGGANGAVSVPENTVAVTTVTATDVDDATSTLRFAIAGGADAARFAIDSVSGALSFLAAPDFESPQDVGGDNIYNVTVSVTDGSLTDTQALAVTVTDVNDTTPTPPPTPTTPSAGPDLLTGTAGADSINGGAGDDTINGGSGNDVIFGGAGADQITATPLAGEKATLYGGNGFLDPNDAGDTISVSGAGSADVYGNGGDDVITFNATGAGNIFGGVGDDRVTISNNADNAVTGGPGADTITITGNGNNLVVGGVAINDPDDGSDTIRITGNGGNVVYANGGDDTVVITGSGNNTVYGGFGNDTIVGGSGDDVIVGGPGANVVAGGAGADRFVYAAGGQDVVTDFSFAQGDQLDLGGQAYTLTSTSDGNAALLLADSGIIVLQGVTEAAFQSEFVV